MDLRSEFPQTEGFSRTNLYYIKHWYEFFSAHHEIVHQLGGQIERIADRAISSIGILLCKDKDSSVVEWSLRGITTPLGVASYQLQKVYDRTMLEMKQQSEENISI